MLTLLAMIAFASNSLLCRAALKESSIDPAAFTFLRIFSGAVALWLIMSLRKRIILERTTSPLVETGSSSSLVARHVLFRYGNWISAAALFVYAAGFSFAYVSLSAGTGALLLFGAVQATMILWGLHKGERLSTIQIVGFILAVIGFVVLVFPGLSAPPLAGSILMLGAGVAWGVYSLRGKRHGRKFCPRSSVRDCSDRRFRSMDACRFCGNRLRHNIGRGYIRSRLCRLV
jgi:drug/metabolite transporter (DMT)-like permease